VETTTVNFPAIAMEGTDQVLPGYARAAAVVAGAICWPLGLEPAG